MSIQLIARDLYRLEKEVSEIEQRLANVGPEQREDLEERLRKVRADRDRMRNVLEGAKGDPSCRHPR
jgi:hypothetical protein